MAIVGSRRKVAISGDSTVLRIFLANKLNVREPLRPITVTGPQRATNFTGTEEQVIIPC